MNRAGMFQIPPLLHQQQQQQQQMMMIMGGSPSFWSFNSNTSPPPPHHNSSIIPMSPNCHETQQLHQPESWSQLLLGGYDGGEEEAKKMEGNWEEQLVAFPSTAADVITKHELVVSENNYLQNQLSLPKSAWSTQPLPPALVSPTSCNSLISKNMLGFSSNQKPSMANTQPSAADDQKCNSTSTGAVAKKPRVQGAFSSQSTFKVRKEKLGDRITALHQIVSPFGKTDTASVLLEAIGYIRFLQSQIEALSSPYLTTGPDQNMSMKPPPALLNGSSGVKKKRGLPDHEEASCNDEEAAAKMTKMRDLRSRGLCLVPVSFILHVGSEAGSGDYLMALPGAF